MAISTNVALLLLALAFALPSPAAHAQRATPVDVAHELVVELDPRTRMLRVTDSIRLRGEGPVEVGLSAHYRIELASFDDVPLGSGRIRGDLRIYDLSTRGTHRLELRYAGEVAPLVQTDHRGTLHGLQAMAGEEGSYLPASSGWYPMIGDAPMRYRLTMQLPAGQRGLVAGRQVEESESAQGYRARYEFAEPTEGIDLMAGPYVVQSRDVNVAGKRVRLRTWFHPAISDLSGDYLDATARYVQRYSAQLGRYPFDEFGVVSSPLPTGFGMPTLTYLGVDVLRLPFIRATSLGHEVLHNWWGNGVYVDYACGNWAEGLTTFMADYAYKEAEGPDAARAMRLDWLRDFAAIPGDQDTPLRNFTTRTHGMSQIVGYNKAAFVFFMLRAEIGDDAFDRGLRLFWEANRFRRAGWDDLRSAFEQASGQELSGFFRQWLERSGAPRVRIETARRVGSDLHVTLAQDAQAYTLQVPVDLLGDAPGRREVLRMSGTRQTFIVRDAQRVDAVSLDPDLQAFRLLDRAELPPILRNVMLDAATRLLVVGDASFREAASELAQAVLDHAPAAADGFAERAPLLIVAPLDDIDALLSAHALPAPPNELRATGTAKVWAAKRTDGVAVLVIAARDAQAVSALRRSLPHYGKQSWLVFEQARAIARGTWPVQAQRVRVTQ